MPVKKSEPDIQTYRDFVKQMGQCIVYSMSNAILTFMNMGIGIKQVILLLSLVHVNSAIDTMIEEKTTVHSQ